MNLWLEDVKKNEFHICMRELMAFDGIHSDLKVVSWQQNFCTTEKHLLHVHFGPITGSKFTASCKLHLLISPLLFVYFFGFFRCCLHQLSLYFFARNRLLSLLEIIVISLFRIFYSFYFSFVLASTGLHTTPFPPTGTSLSEGKLILLD